MAARNNHSYDRRVLLVRMSGAASVVIIVVCVASDWFTDFWVDHPMATAFLSGLLLIVLGGAVVNEYLSNRARRQWQTVAALAVTQIRDGVRGVASSLGVVLGLEDSDSQSTLTLQSIAPEDGARQQFVEAGVRVLGTREAKDALAIQILANLRSGQPIAATWAPVMISERAYVWVLDEYVSLLNRLWRVLWAIDDRDLRGGRSAPPDVAIANELADLIIDLVTLESELTVMIRDLLPWPRNFGPPPSTLVADSWTS